jgi:hypothetical protein
MKYMLTIFADESGWEDVTPEQMQEGMEMWSQFGRDLNEAGAFIAGEGLQESSTATTVKHQPGGDRLVTDGPFAEAKEQLGGFYLVECENLDEALEWAKKIPVSEGGSIEVRPVQDYTEYGYDDPNAKAATA